jgi:hypothetical protein
VKLLGTEQLRALNKATRAAMGTSPMDKMLADTLEPDGTHLVTKESPYSPDGAERPTFARCTVSAMLVGHDETVLIWCDLPLAGLDRLATSNGRTIVGPSGQGSIVLDPDHKFGASLAATLASINPKEASGDPAGA